MRAVLVLEIIFSMLLVLHAAETDTRNDDSERDQSK